ncbi:lectin [Enterococcus faecium]|uniref:lectin-like domain-containing protein n=1 Tax=Enterococcus faecium TaxID=1352 RepID=UPI000A344B87|nr:MucBP domain-containing protein [Enterococcus faecium]EGP4757673.1 lectin [Enterococcus faecium]EGP4885057.1 lectin [Enterococcus faecium]EGP4981485.1 lectin [Enterococcus faecium]EGP5416413.1 lectin [Enterococcus faecium]EGP5711668.1 lectin [Enterococcus faecium]
MKKRRIALILSSLLATNIFPIIGYSLESNQLVNDNRRVEESKEALTLDRLTESSQIQESSENSSTTDSKETTDKEESEELIKQPLENAPTYRVGLPNDPNIISIDKIFQQPIGTSTSILENGKLLQLNPAERSQRGAIWSNNKIDLRSDFTFKCYLYLGNQRDKAGDGMTFTLTGDSRMANDPSQVIGSPGMGIGSYSTRSGQPYVANALSIEFDTYKNSGSSDRMDREITADNKGHGHVAFVTPKPNNNNYSGEHTGVTVAPTFLSDGTWRTLIIQWDASQRSLTYDLEGVGRSSHIVPDLISQFGSTEVNWGFTSSTGTFFQENAIAMTQLPSNVSSSADVKVNDSDYGAIAEVERNDKITIRNTLKVTGNFLEDKKLETSIDLPQELNIPERILINGNQVDAKDILITGNRVTLNLGDYFVLGDTLIIELETDLREVIPEKVLTMHFEYLENAKLIEQSNDISLTIAKLKEIDVHVYYKEKESQNDLAEMKTITGKIGENYKEVPIDIEGYVFDSDSANTEGVFSENTADIYFYYRKGKLYLSAAPQYVDFGQHKISNKPLSVFGQFSGGLKIMDERASGGWTLQLKQEKVLTNGTFELPEALSFVTSEETTVIGSSAVTIFESDQKGESDLSAILDSTSQHGIRIDIPVENQRIGTFEGKLSWILADVPEN